jgi:hypothetical protein
MRRDANIKARIVFGKETLYLLKMRLSKLGERSARSIRQLTSESRWPEHSISVKLSHALVPHKVRCRQRVAVGVDETDLCPS